MNPNSTISNIPWFVAGQLDVNIVTNMNGSTDYTGEGLIWSLKLQLHRNSETLSPGNLQTESYRKVLVQYVMPWMTWSLI